MTIKNLIFDLDDTLVYCAKFYVEARHVFVRYQHARTGLESTFIEKLFSDLDLTCITLPDGFNRERYPRSFAATSAILDVIRGFPVDTHAMEVSRAIGDTVFAAEYPLIPGIAETLLAYKDAGIKLFMCTKGDVRVQNRKLNLNSLLHIFDETKVYIVPKNTGEVVVKIMTENKLRPEETLFVGDSVKDDIGSAHEAGIQAVLIADPNKPVWNYEDKAHTPDYVIASVAELPTILIPCNP